MRNCLIGCVVLLAMAGTAVSETKGPPKDIAVDLGRGVKLEMVLIPAGSFLMGDAKGDDDAKPIHKVTITKPFYLGKYDMHGNVWEWCADWYDSGYYAKSPADDPKGPTTGSGRVRRGGSSYDSAKGCRSANRLYLVPEECDLDLGVRVSRIVEDK